MTKLLTLLKYADPSKISTSAIVEVFNAFKIKLEEAEAAEIANVFRTRGLAGLLPLVPKILEIRKRSLEAQETCLIMCPKCGHWLSPEPDNQ